MRIRLILLGFFLIAIVFTICITSGTVDNLSNQDTIYSPSVSNAAFVTTADKDVASDDRAYCNETMERLGNLSGRTSPTACFDYGENASFELSHGPVTIQRNGTSDTEQSYLVKTNITLNNTGLVPIDLVYGVVVLKDDVGDSCVYNLSFTCGINYFGTQNNDGYFWLEPGKSETKPIKTIIVSAKSIEYLSSQKFFHQGVLAVQWKLPDGNVTGRYGDRREWLIDLNQTETPEGF